MVAGPIYGNTLAQTTCNQNTAYFAIWSLLYISVCIHMRSVSHPHVGMLQAPQQFTLSKSNSAVNISWIVPDSFQVSTPPMISHYVLSNNLTNDTKTFNNPTTCKPLASCNYSMDSFFISVGSLNATILDYNGTIIFTFFAVNGAGNGNSATYVYGWKTTGLEILCVLEM